MKTCSCCGQAKEYSEFYRNSAAADGLTPDCRACQLRLRRETRRRLTARSDAEVEAAAAARGHKMCISCKQDRIAATEFPRDRGRPDGRGARCSPCAAEKAKLDRHNRRTVYADRAKATYGRNRERFRKDQLKAKFGLTPDQYQAMHDGQGGTCAICSEPEIKMRNGRLCDLAVDHDHQTGVVRQLLCSRCNIGLGWFRESPELLERAALYLTNHQNVIRREAPPPA